MFSPVSSLWEKGGGYHRYKHALCMWMQFELFVGLSKSWGSEHVSSNIRIGLEAKVFSSSSTLIRDLLASGFEFSHLHVWALCEPVTFVFFKPSASVLTAVNSIDFETIMGVPIQKSRGTWSPHAWLLVSATTRVILFMHSSHLVYRDLNNKVARANFTPFSI